MTLRLNGVETQLGEPERVRRNGEEFLKVPVVAGRQQVYEYNDVDDAEDREFLPEAELSALSQRINSVGGIPVSIDHPVAKGPQGLQPVSADSPQAINPTDVGTFEDTRVNATDEGPKLAGAMYLRVAERRLNGETFTEAFDTLEDGGTVPVSPGYDVGTLDRTAGEHDGERYSAVQRELQPDHLALVLRGTARCSPPACAAGRANSSLPTNDDGQVTFRAMTDASDDTADDPAGLADVTRRNAFGMLLDRLLGKDTDERQNAADHPDLPDDTRDTTDDQREDESADADTADTTDTTSTTMQDSDMIDELVDDHGLDRENMEPLEGEDCLDDIYERFNAETDTTDGGEATEADTTETPDEPGGDTTEETGDTPGGESNDTDDTMTEDDTEYVPMEKVDDIVDERIEQRQNSKEREGVIEQIRANSEQFGEDDLDGTPMSGLLSIRDMVMDGRQNAAATDPQADMAPLQTEGPVRQNADLDGDTLEDVPSGEWSEHRANADD